MNKIISILISVFLILPASTTLNAAAGIEVRGEREETPEQDLPELTLDDALKIALRNNYGIVTTLRKEEIAALQNTWGNAGALPQIKLSGNAGASTNSYNIDDYTTHQLNGSVDFNWTLFRGFKARIQKDQLEELEKLSKGNTAVIVENTIYNVILSYYNVLLSKEQKHIAQNSMQLSSDRFKREQHSKEIGASNTYELLQAQNAYLQDSSDYLLSKAIYNNSIRELNYLMAEPMDNKYQFRTNFIPDTTPFLYKTLEEKMLSKNNTLKNQYINLELARLDVKKARSTYSPQITLNGSGGYSNTGQEYQTLSQQNQQKTGYFASGGIAISYTLFDGNSRKQAVMTASIEEEIAEVRIDEMEQELKNQLAQEYELYNVRRQILEVAKENMKAAELNLNLSHEKYQNGSINSFNFRDVQNIYLNTAYQYQNAIFSVIQSYNNLLRLTGGLLE